jgi:UDP-N-acetyl-D-mannosaminuronic acid dehydrogenase
MSFEDVLLVEPNINAIPKGFDEKKVNLTTMNDALKVADIVVLLVDHTSFKSMDLSLLSDKQVVDTRGIWS